MADIKFNDIANNLKIGREIEFVYNKKKYSITNNNNYWYLCCDTDNVEIEKICKFNEKDLLISKVSKIEIDNESIEKIFDYLKYDSNNIFIL